MIHILVSLRESICFQNDICVITTNRRWNPSI